jgi:hypothetical protein
LAARENGPTHKALALSLLSHANACNPLLQAHPSALGAGQHEGRGFPLTVLPPLCPVSRQPIWAGTRSDNLLVGPGTPRGRNADKSQRTHRHAQKIFPSLLISFHVKPFTCPSSRPFGALAYHGGPSCPFSMRSCSIRSSCAGRQPLLSSGNEARVPDRTLQR